MPYNTGYVILDELNPEDAKRWLDVIRARKGNLFDSWQSLPDTGGEVFLYYTTIDDVTTVRELIDLGVWDQVVHPGILRVLIQVIIKHGSWGVLRLMFDLKLFNNKHVAWMHLAVLSAPKNGNAMRVLRFLLSRGFEYTGPARTHFREGDLDGRVRGELVSQLINYRRCMPNHALLEIYSYVHWPYLPRNQAGFEGRCLKVFSDFSRPFWETGD